MWLSAPSVITSTPRAIRAFCRRPTGRSLPGITREEKIAVSPASSTRSRCSPVAILAIEARGSPWLPVQMNSTFSRGR